MPWIAEHWFHLILIAIYLAILVKHALTGKRNVQSVDDYLVAGRRLGGFVIAVSYYATFMSTNTFIGAAGKSWQHGLTWCVGGIALSGLAALSWWVIAPRFVPLTRQYHSLTVADFLGSHYQSERVRKVAAVIVAFSSVLYLIAIYRGASLALESFLDLPYTLCVFAVLVIVTAYTLMGGFESVVLTDALQGVLMLFGAVALLVAVFWAGNGPVQLMDQVRAIDVNLVSFSSEAFYAALAYSLAVGVKYLVEPRQLSRFYGLKDQRALRIAAIVAPLAILLTYICLLPLGAFARALIPAQEITQTDRVIPYLLGDANLLGTFVGTAFLLVLVSAAMSSIDSVLLVAASTIDRDLISSSARRTESTASHDVGSQKTNASVLGTRAWVVVVSLAAALSALLPFTKDIVQMTAFSGSLYGACFVPVLAIGIFLRKRSEIAAIVTMVVGSIAVIGAFTLRKLEIWTTHEVYIGMMCGLITFAVLQWRWAVPIKPTHHE